MSSRHIFDAAGTYRERTLTMSPGPSSTFSCGVCGVFKSILGRKSMPSPSARRRIYKCAQCVKDGK